MVALLMGLLFMTWPTSAQQETITFNKDLPTILMGEMWFAVPGGPKVPFPPGTAPQNILTIAGAASGEIRFNVSNEGAAVLHEIRSPLFMAAKEVKVLLFDPNDKFVAEFEGTDLLEQELGVGYKAEFRIVLAGAVSKSFQKDPSTTMVFEISCHVAGHYEGGMRALITLAQ